MSSQVSLDLEKAEKSFRRALQISPNLSLAHNNLGEIFLNRGEIDSALHHLQLALRSDPNYALAHYNLGLAYQKKGLLKEAKEAYQKTLKIIPEFKPALDALKALN